MRSTVTTDIFKKLPDPSVLPCAEIGRHQRLYGLSHTAVHSLYQCRNGGHDAVNGQFHRIAIAQDLVVCDGGQNHRAQIQQAGTDTDDENFANGLPHAEGLGQF